MRDNLLRKSRYSSALAIVILMASGGMLHAQDRSYEGTWAQRRACRPDVFRLCSSFIPNRPAITDCLERNKPRLSQDCLAVMEGRFR